MLKRREVPESLPIPLLWSSSNLRHKRLASSPPELAATHCYSGANRVSRETAPSLRHHHTERIAGDGFARVGPIMLQSTTVHGEGSSILLARGRSLWLSARFPGQTPCCRRSPIYGSRGFAVDKEHNFAFLATSGTLRRSSSAYFRTPTVSLAYF
jgi:hypothetical protein